MATNLPNPGLYFQGLGSDIIALRDAIDDLLKDGAYLNAMGGSGFLQNAPFNLAPADANLYVATIGAVTPSNSTVQAIQAFLNSAVPITGGA